MNHRIISAILFSFVMVTSVIAVGVVADAGKRIETETTIDESREENIDEMMRVQEYLNTKTGVRESQKTNSTESLLASSSPTELLNETYDTGNDDRFNSMIRTSDGGYLFGGETAGVDAWLVKTDAKGNVEWDKVIDTGSSGDEIRSVTETSNGYAFTGIGDYGFWIGEVDSNGNLLWDDHSFGASRGKSIISTSDGGLLAVGRGNDGTSPQFQVVKINGSEQFNKSYGDTKTESASSVVEVSDGYIVAGYDSDEGAELLKVDDSGTKQWAKTYGGYDANSISKTSAGGFVFGGEKNGAAWLVKLDSSANKQWGETYNETEYTELAKSVAQTDSGGFVFAGYLGGFPSEAWLVRTDPSGTKLWEEKYGKSSNDDRGNSVLVSDGNYTMAGETGYGNNPENGLLVKYGVPEIQVSPSSLDYGDVKAGESSTASVTVENVGSAPLEISDMSITGDGDFSLIGGNAPFVLEPDETKNVEVEFTPEKEGKRKATLEIESNDTDNPTKELSLEGYGVIPDISATRTKIQYVGNGTKTFYIENNGDASLKVADISVTGRNPSNFEVKSSNSFTVPSGERERIKIKFSASTEDEKEATLEIESDDPDTPKSEVDLVGVIKNDKPQPNFKYSPQDPTVGETIKFDARESTDDYGVESIQWEFDDDGEYEGSSPLSFYTFSETGKYNVTLKVVDKYGKSATLTKTVEVSEPEKGSIIYSDFRISDREVNVSEKIEVSANVLNTGGVKRNYTAVLKISNLSNLYRSGVLGPKESETVRYVFEIQSSGTYNFSIGGLGPVTVEVVGDENENETVSVVEAIANLESQDDKISFDELQTAISYWSSGETVPKTGGKTIDFSKLQELITLWSQGEKI